MTFWLKNCGLRTVEAIACASENYATHIGLVHYPESPRHVSLEEGALLRTHIPSHIETVAVLVNPDNTLLEALCSAWNPTLLQIHDVDDAERLRDIQSRTERKLILARGVDDITTINKLAAASGASALLLDTPHATQHGGSGTSFDWSLLNNTRPYLPWFLAGGLTTDTVANAIAHTRPTGVDVSSGIEASRGVKSIEKIVTFNRAVLEAFTNSKAT
jgi:phosphoribosylanthranilate isomerase